MVTIKGEETSLGKSGKRIRLEKAQALENLGKRLDGVAGTSPSLEGNGVV